jgi:hypothetical protein
VETTTKTGANGLSLAAQIAQLRQLKVRQLRARYREVFGQETATAHKQHLVRRIAWRLQALSGGDLSERAHRRALEMADDADLRRAVPSEFAQTKARRSLRDTRLPDPGALLTRVYQDQTIEVRVLADGFEYNGQRYDSLSAVARRATGTRWNGLVFFGLAKRGPGREKRRAAR